MLLSEKKKLNNISEYIIHMYQTEDLIRSFEFDLDQINTYVLKHIPGTIEDKKELLLWYAGLIEKMRNEKIEKSGHLHEVTTKVDQMKSLHNKMKDSEKEYQKVIEKSSPHINKFNKLGKDMSLHIVDICFNGIYGLLLLKLQGKKVSSEDNESLEAFGDILSYLSYKYKQQKFTTDN